MEISHWITIGVFVLTNGLVWAGVVISLRVDMGKMGAVMGKLQEDLQAVEKSMEKFGNILVTLADFKGEMNLIQERLLAQGKRLDEAIASNNQRQQTLWEKVDRISSAEG